MGKLTCAVSELYSIAKETKCGRVRAAAAPTYAKNCNNLKGYNNFRLLAHRQPMTRVTNHAAAVSRVNGKNITKSNFITILCI